MPMPFARSNPLAAMLDFASARNDEATNLGSIISQIASPILGQMGADTSMMAQPAVMRGPVPQAQPLGPQTALPMAPIPVDFNPKSTELLSAADPRLVDIMTETERRAREQGIEIQVSETKRSQERQKDMVAQGKSQTMNSKHLTGNAADIYIQNPDGSANYDFEAYRPVAEIAKQVAAEKGYDDFAWGGDWKTLKDGVHFQVGGAAGTPSAMGGPAQDTLGMNVEDILAQLYPQMSPEDEKKQRRKDFFAAASQGLSALSQGRPQDFSNIRQMQEERRTQAVQDMRERERARAAANLVYSQTGDSALATGIATGAINYSDVLSERQLRRANEEADNQRIKDAASAGVLADTMAKLNMDSDLVEAARKGVDVGPSLELYDKKRIADDLAETETRELEVFAQNEADAQIVLQSAAPGSVEARAAERVIALGGRENVYDIIKERTPAGGEAFTLSPGQQRFDAAGAPIASVPETVVAKEYAPSEAVKTWQDSRAVAESRGQDALAAFDAAYPTAADFDMARSGKLGGVASTVDSMNADLIAKGLMVVPDPANPALPLIENGQIKTVEIEGGPAQQARIKIEQDEKKAAADQEVAATKSVLRRQQDEVRGNNTMRLLKDVHDKSLDFNNDAVSGVVRGIVASVLPGSEAGQAKGQLAGVQVGIFVDQLSAMRESSPTGAAVGNVTEGERDAFYSTYGNLDIAGSPQLLRENVRAIANAGLDLQYGTPAALRKAVEDGKLDAETAERYGARYDIKGTSDSEMVGDLGKVVPLGLTSVDENVLASTAPASAKVSPDSPDPEYEASLLANPDLITSMTLEEYKALSPERKAVFDSLAGGKP